MNAAPFGIDRAQAAGKKARVDPYADGWAGIQQSATQIAKYARESRHDTDLRRWAGEALSACGFDGRVRTGTIKERAQCILDKLRSQTTYVPDPVGTEWIQAPHVTLCLRDMCIPFEDCDGLKVAYSGALLTVGISAWIVVQDFGAGRQPHVLVGLEDENGLKLYADPANTMAPIYSGSRAMREQWIDPMNETSLQIGTSGNEFVTLGSTPIHRRIERMNERLGRPGNVSHRRLMNGRWFGYYPDIGSWAQIQFSCSHVSAPVALRDMGVLQREAESQLAASGGDPVVETWVDGNTYLFAIESGRVVIRACGGVAQVGAAGSQEGFGALCSLDGLLAYKRRLIGPWTSLNSDLVDCPGITLDQKTAWRSDFASFNSWYAGALPLCDADAEIREGQDFEVRLDKWRAVVVAAGCQPTDPPLAPLPSSDPKSINYIAPESAVVSTIKAVVTGGVVLGGAAAVIYGIKLATEATKLAEVAHKAQPAAGEGISHKHKSALFIGGGAVAAIGGLALALWPSSAAASQARLPQDVTPIPSSSQLVGSKTISYKGVPIRYGTDWNTPGNWIGLWTINFQDFGTEKRTNESGIIEYIQAQIDAYFAAIQWVALDTSSGFTMQPGSVYRVSMPATSANTVAFPALNGVQVSGSSLPIDWPASDASDPTRVRSAYKIPVASQPVAIPAVDGMTAWVLVTPS